MLSVKEYTSLCKSLKPAQTGYWCGYKDGFNDIGISTSGNPELYPICSNIDSQCERIVKHFARNDLEKKYFDRFYDGYQKGYSSGIAMKYNYHVVLLCDSFTASEIKMPAEMIEKNKESPVTDMHIEEEVESSSLAETPVINTASDSISHQEEPTHTASSEYRNIPIPTINIECPSDYALLQKEAGVLADDMSLDVREAVQLYNAAMHSFTGGQNDFHRRYTPIPFGIERGEGSLRRRYDLSPFILDTMGHGMLFFVCAFRDDDNWYAFPSFGFDSKDVQALEHGGFFDFFEGDYARQNVKLVKPAICRFKDKRLDLSEGSTPIVKGLIERR